MRCNLKVLFSRSPCELHRRLTRPAGNTADKVRNKQQNTAANTTHQTAVQASAKSKLDKYSTQIQENKDKKDDAKP